MIFSLFKTKCPICNMVVDKDKAINHGDKYFCSEDHAEQYGKEGAKEQSKHDGHGNCCH